MPINTAHILKASQFELLAKKIVEGFITGLHRSPFHGFSVEFSEHRNYNTGESPRNIDWKLFARTDKLFVKKYEEETNLRCHLLVDLSSSMEFPESSNENLEQLNKKGFACYTAAALALLLNKQRDAVSLSLFDEELQFQSPCKNNKNHLMWLISNLESAIDKNIQENTKGKINESIRKLASQSPKRSLFIIISDFIFDKPEHELNELSSTLQFLRHQQHEVLAFNIFDEGLEKNLDFGKFPQKFEDLESKREVKLNPVEIKAAYQKKRQVETQALQNIFNKHQIDLIDCPTNRGFDKLLLAYLNKRNRTR